MSARLVSGLRLGFLLPRLTFAARRTATTPAGLCEKRNTARALIDEGLSWWSGSAVVFLTDGIEAGGGRFRDDSMRSVEKAEEAQWPLVVFSSNPIAAPLSCMPGSTWTGLRVARIGYGTAGERIELPYPTHCHDDHSPGPVAQREAPTHDSVHLGSACCHHQRRSSL